MRRARSLAFFLFFVGLHAFLMSTAHAEEWPELRPPATNEGGAKDVAVIVAIEHYAHLPTIDGARRNAAAWEAYFKRTLGMTDVVVLLDRDAQEFALLDAVEAAAKRAPDDGTLWFVFIGHGAPAKSGKDGLLVGEGAQASARALEARSVKRSEVLRLIAKGQQKRSVVVLDACFSGAYGSKDNPLAPGLQPLLPVNLTPVDGSLLVMSAGKSDQYAGPLPGESRPAFSYLLLQGLIGQADEDFDRRVTANEAVSYAVGVLQTHRARIGRTQEPQITPERSKNWVLTPNVDPTANCTQGKTRGIDTVGQCCWPGQSWSEAKTQCIGQPDRCPDGLFPGIDDCVTEDQLQVTTTSGISMTTWGWVTLGTGVAFVGGGLGLHFAAEAKRDDIRDFKVNQAQAVSVQEDANLFDTLGVVGMSVGSAAVVTGLLLVLLDDDEDAEPSPAPPSVSWGVTDQGMWLMLGGTF